MPLPFGPSFKTTGLSVTTRYSNTRRSFARSAVLGLALLALGCWNLVLGVHRIPLKNLPKIRPNPRGGRSVCISLCESDQTDRRRELRVLHRGCYAPDGLRVCDVRRHLENFFREMIDTIKKAATAGNENAGAEIIDERFLFEPAFEQLESLHAVAGE